MNSQRQTRSLICDSSQAGGTKCSIRLLFLSFLCHFPFHVCHFFDKYFLCVSCVCVIMIGQCWISAEQGVRLNREPGENPGGKTPLYAYRNCTCRKTVTGRPGRPCRIPLRCDSEELLQRICIYNYIFFICMNTFAKICRRVFCV